MAELLPNGQQPVKRLQPSRLKYEVQAESTDDERVPENSSFQKSNSQTVVSETQLEHQDCGRGHDNESDYGDGLSPRSVAVLDQYATKKDAKTSDTSFAVKYLTKERFHVGSSSVALSSVGFSFSQPWKASTKTSPEAESTASLPAIEPGSAVADSTKAGDSAPKDVILFDLIPSKSTGSVTEQAPRYALGTEGLDAKDAYTSLKDDPQELVNAPITDHAGDEPCDTVYEMPASAQPSAGPLIVAKKNKTAKKGKRSKKAMLGQQRGAPWPPVAVGKPSQVHMASPPTEHLEDCTSQFIGGDAGSSEAYHKHRRETQVHASPPPEDMAVYEAQPKMRPFNETGHDTDQVQQHESLPYGADDNPEDLFLLPTDQPSFSLEPQASAQFTPHAHIQPSSHASREYYVRENHSASRPKLRHAPVPRPSRTQDNNTQANNLDPRMSQIVTSAVDKELPRQEQADTVLHDVSNRGGPNRVEKPQKKKRVVSGPQSLNAPSAARIRGISMHGSFEQTLESLRIAHLAEQYRMNHDRTTQAKHFDEVKALLQDQINQYSIAVAEWKDKYNGLNGGVATLREKAKTNQKFITGLQKDYEKLHKSFISFQDECKKTLQHKIAEIESEKEALRRELETTVETLAKGQKTMKKTVDDVYTKYIISESKRKDLAENLSHQVAMYEEEKTKRTDLEKQLLSSVQSVERQLSDRSAAMIEKLANLQTSIEGVAATEGQDSGIQDCLTALQGLQETRFSTTRDVQKAEDMLRFVHEDFDSKLNALFQSMENKTCSTRTIEAFLTGQLRNFRTEMLKYDEVAAESQKAQQANEALKQQLETEQELTQRLKGQIKVLERNKKDLRKSQLEGLLPDLSDKTQNIDEDSSTHEQELTDLRQQPKIAEDERSTAKFEVERLERLVQKRDRKLGDLERSDVYELRKVVQQELQQEFAEAESGLRHDNHRLTKERDEIQGLHQELEKKVESARARIKDLGSELELARKEKMEADFKLKTVQRAAHSDASSSTEIGNLKERLRQKMEELHSKDDEYTELKRRHAQLESSKTDLQILCEQQQAEISQHSSVIDVLRQETETERDEEQANGGITTKLSQNELFAIQRDKDILQTKLERAQVEESRLIEVQNTLLAERDNLRNQNAELRVEKEASKTQLLRIQQEKAQEARKYAEIIDTLQRRQERSDAALKEAEATMKREDAQHRKKIEFDRKKFEAIIQGLQNDSDKWKAKVVSRDSVQQQEAQSSSGEETSPRSLYNIKAENKKKKVMLQNNSVLNIVGASPVEADTSANRNGDLEHNHTMFDEEVRNGTLTQESQDDFEYSNRDLAAEQVAETQEMASVSFSLADFNDNFSLPSQPESSALNMRSTDGSSLSALGSDELIQLQDDIQHGSTIKLHGRDRSSVKQPSSQTHVMETPTRPNNKPNPGSQSSRSPERPTSQANTASRMMPPPKKKSHSFNPRKPNAIVSDENTGRRSVYDDIGHTLRCEGESSPDFMHHPPLSKHTYAQNDSEPTGRNGDVLADSRSSKYTHSQKRKGSPLEDTSTKKRRTSSQSYSNPSSDSQSNLPFPSGPSAVARRSRFLKSPSLQPTPSSRYRNQASSSGHPPRTPSRAPGSGMVSQSCGQQAPASRASPAASGRRTSSRQVSSSRHSTTSRQTRSKTREDRFDQELRSR